MLDDSIQNLLPEKCDRMGNKSMVLLLRILIHLRSVVEQPNKVEKKTLELRSISVLGHNSTNLPVLLANCLSDKKCNPNKLQTQR